MTLHSRTILLLFLLGVAGLPQVSLAQQAAIVDSAVEREADLLLVRFRVEGAFTQSIRDAIQSGAPTTFTFVMRVYKSVDRLPDERISTTQVQRTVQFDSLRQRYLVTLEGQQFIARDLTEAEALMTEVRGIPVALAPTLDPASEYYVLAKAELAEVQLPFVFSFLRFLVQMWDFETPWTRIELPGNWGERR